MCMCMLENLNKKMIELHSRKFISFRLLNAPTHYTVCSVRTWDLLLLAIDFCRFCVVIRFFIPATTANDLRLRRIFYPWFYLLHLFSYLNSLEREPVFPFSMFSAKQGNYWYRFYNVFGMTWSTTRKSRRRYMAL